MNKTQKPLLQFPCNFPIKIVGKKTPEFEQEVLKIIQKYHPKFLAEHCSRKPSKNETYLSITATINAKSKKQLDDLYLDLTKSKHTVMVL